MFAPMRILIAVLGLFLSGCVASQPEVMPAPSAKRIALTYDDAPTGDGPRFVGERRTPEFLRQLEEADVGEVTIFVTTAGLEDPCGPVRIEAYAANGHLIANHSDKHLWASRTPVEEYLADIDLAETKLQGMRNRRPWYRFPFLDEGGVGEGNRDGVRRDELRAGLAQRGLSNGYVTIDNYDWHLDALWKRAVKDGKDVNLEALGKLYVDMIVGAANHYDTLSQSIVGRRINHVLLLHENDLAASFTVQLVRALREDGWEIISADAAYADPIAEIEPETVFAHKGKLVSIALDNESHTREEMSHWSASIKAIEERMYSYGVVANDD